MRRALPPRDERGRFLRREDRVVLDLVPLWIRRGGLTGDPESIVAVFQPVEPKRRK